MPSSLKEQWSEFDWEKELRKDDERVNVYFRELPKYIDLPGEDEVICKSIQRRRDLAPHGSEWPFHAPGSEPAEPDDSPETEEERKRWDSEWQKREGAETYILCGRIARDLCTIFSEKSPDVKTSRNLMRALCLVGKMMARSTDLIELEPGELPALRVALCKRLASDANDILGILDSFEPADADSDEILGSAYAGVHEAREQVLDILANARKPQKPPRFGTEEDEAPL